MTDKIKSAFSEIRADDDIIEKTTAYLRSKREGRSARARKPYVLRSAAALSVVVMLVAGVSWNLFYAASAYVSIDMNPSMELILNRFDKVIATRALNEEGGDILSGAVVKGKRYDEAAGAVISLAETGGYLTDGVLVSITVRTADAEKEKLLCSVLWQFVNEQIRSVQAAAEVEVYPVSAEIWTKARGCHLSPAKYLAISELMEVDAQATIEEYGGYGINVIRQRTRECHSMSNAVSDPGVSNTDVQNGHGHKNRHGHGSRH